MEKNVLLSAKKAMEIKTSVIGGKKIRYSDEGVGRNLVLLHGFIERIEIWEDFSNQLSAINRVVCIELPGHGESELVDEVQTMEKMANHIHVLIEKLGLKNYGLVGHSMGGYLALAYAEQYEDELAGLGLFHSNILSDSDDQKRDRERAISVIERDKSGYIFNFIPNLFAPCNQQRLAFDIEKLQQGASGMSKEALISCLRGMSLRTDKVSFFYNTDLPIMMILGKEDSRSPVQSGMAQALIPKHAEVLILGDCGHMGYLEKPAETVQFIQSFLNHCTGVNR